MKKYFGIFIAIFMSIMIIVPALVAVVDPSFVYHAPLKNLYYVLDNPHYQGMGIARWFEYDAVITGTSLTENFKTTEFDALYGTSAVKLPSSGATFFETRELVECGYRSGHNIRYVLRSLDINHLADEADALRDDLGEYPEYLYNDTFLDDYKYLLNEDTIVTYCVPTIARFFMGKDGGHTSFDDYFSADWKKGDGHWTWSEEPFTYDITEQSPLSQEDRERLLKNVKENILDLANDHPETTFIYFIPPYSTAWWKGRIQDDEFESTLTGVELAAEQMLECDNIELYCFGNRTELTTDLDNYVDSAHYTNDINSMILRWCVDGQDRLSKDNYMEQIDAMRQFYGSYRYKTGYRNSEQ